MLINRKALEDELMKHCETKGFQLARKSSVHAGGKMIWRYPSVLGHKGNLEIDLNYMYRTTLWPIKFQNSKTIGNYSINNIPILDFYELAAGKLSALFDRTAGRDLFDTFHLLTQDNIDFEKLRLAFVIYTAMNHKKDFQGMSYNQINFDPSEFRNRVLPMLSQQYLGKIKNFNE
jgi:hypothetical protein